MPIRELASFKRIGFAANSKQSISFTLEPDELSYIDIISQVQIYRGRLQVSLGAGQGIKLDDKKVVTASINLKP